MAELPLGRQLAMALKGLRAAGDENLAAIDTSLASYLVLRHVEDNPGSSQRDVAQRLGIEGPTFTHHVDRLTERGLVERVRSDEDRRVWSVVLTDAGREHLGAARRIADAGNDRLRALFSDDEWSALTGYLQRISDHYGRSRP